MKTRIRRENQFRQREIEFLDLARHLIADGGLAGFNMDRLAEATEYSKGTVYQHFGSKEDLLTALAVQSMERRLAWFDRACHCSGRTRDKMLALTIAEEIFVKLQPLHFRSELMIKLADFRDRASVTRTTELERLEGRCFDLVRAVTEEAVAIGDLRLKPGQTIPEIVTGFIALHIGTFILMLNFPEIVRLAGADDPLRSLRNQVSILLDGLGWQPLSTESDPSEVYRRVLNEVFSDESRRAGLVV
jgi:AcrR family transcriptional regulator